MDDRNVNERVKKRIQNYITSIRSGSFGILAIIHDCMKDIEQRLGNVQDEELEMELQRIWAVCHELDKECFQNVDQMIKFLGQVNLCVQDYRRVVHGKSSVAVNSLVEEQVTPMETMASTELEVPTAEETVPTEVEASVAEEAVPTEIEAPVAEEAVPTEVEAPVAEEAVPAEVEVPTAEEAAPVEVEAPVAEEAVPAEVEVPTAEEAVPVEVEAPVAEETVPTEVEAPAAEEAVPTEVEAPAAEEVVPIDEQITPATVETSSVQENSSTVLELPTINEELPKAVEESSSDGKVLVDDIIPPLVASDKDDTPKEINIVGNVDSSSVVKLPFETESKETNVNLPTLDSENKTVFIKDNSEDGKAIIVNSEQKRRLGVSLGTQKSLFETIVGKNSSKAVGGEKLSTETVEDPKAKIARLMDELPALYAKGETAAAEKMAEEISALTKSLSATNS